MARPLAWKPYPDGSMVVILSNGHKLHLSPEQAKQRFTFDQGMLIERKPPEPKPPHPRRKYRGPSDSEPED